MYVVITNIICNDFTNDITNITNISKLFLFSKQCTMEANLGEWVLFLVFRNLYSCQRDKCGAERTRVQTRMCCVLSKLQPEH